LTLGALLRRSLGDVTRHQRLLGEGAWIGGGQLATLLGRLIGLRLLTGLVSPSVFGEVALVVGISTLGSSVFCAPLMHATIRFYADAKRDAQIPALRRLVARLLLRSTAVLVALLLVGGGVWVVATHAVRYVTVLAAAAMLVLDVARTLELNLLTASREQRTFALWTATDAISRPIGAASMVLFTSATAATVIAGYAAATGLTMLVFRRRRPRETGADGPDHAWARQAGRDIVRFALPMVPLAGLGWAMSLGDRYVLAGFAGAGAVGLYSAAYGLASMPFISLAGVVTTTLRPVLFDAVARGERQHERRLLLGWAAMLAVVSGTGVVLLALLAPWVATLALGTAFRGAAGLLPWIAAAYAVQGVQQVFELDIYAHKRTERLIYMQVGATAVALALYFLLIPSLGALGAAIGTLCSMLVSCVAAIVLCGVVESEAARPRRGG